jgi:hypothetical protein
MPGDGMAPFCRPGFEVASGDRLAQGGPWVKQSEPICGREPASQRPRYRLEACATLARQQSSTDILSVCLGRSAERSASQTKGSASQGVDPHRRPGRSAALSDLSPLDRPEPLTLQPSLSLPPGAVRGYRQSPVTYRTSVRMNRKYLRWLNLSGHSMRRPENFMKQVCNPETKGAA